MPTFELLSICCVNVTRLVESALTTVRVEPKDLLSLRAHQTVVASSQGLSLSVATIRFVDFQNMSGDFKVEISSPKNYLPESLLRVNVETCDRFKKYLVLLTPQNVGHKLVVLGWIEQTLS